MLHVENPSRIYKYYYFYIFSKEIALKIMIFMKKCKWAKKLYSWQDTTAEVLFRIFLCFTEVLSLLWKLVQMTFSLSSVTSSNIWQLCPMLFVSSSEIFPFLKNSSSFVCLFVLAQIHIVRLVTEILNWIHWRQKHYINNLVISGLSLIFHKVHIL